MSKYVFETNTEHHIVSIMVNFISQNVPNPTHHTGEGYNPKHSTKLCWTSQTCENLNNSYPKCIAVVIINAAECLQRFR